MVYRFKIRYLINEAIKTPYSVGVWCHEGSKGTVYGIDFKGPCLKCLLKQIPTSAESCYWRITACDYTGSKL